MSRSKKPRKAYRPRPITADTMALATHFAAKPSVGRIIMTTKRGLTHQEAMEYVGVKRRTFDEVWRPQLVAMRQGACLVFDRLDLDRLFDQFKQQASGQPDAANDSTSQALTAHNGGRNERPSQTKGVNTWAKTHGESIPKKTGSGRSTSGSGLLDFSSAALKVMTKRNGG